VKNDHHHKELALLNVMFNKMVVAIMRNHLSREGNYAFGGWEGVAGLNEEYRE
jgi:hypothetical protein